MQQQFEAASATSPADSSHASRFLPLLLILFAGSGAAALIYEIVWFQLLQLAIGATSISMGFLLAAFMGGLCIGSAGWPRMQRYTKMHPLKMYAALEAGIAVLGLLILVGLPHIESVYIIGFQHGLSNAILRGLLAG